MASTATAGEDRHQQKDSTLRQGPADCARDGCNRDTAGVIEGGVAAHAACQFGAPVKAQGERGDRGSEDVSNHRHQAVRHEHMPEIRCDVDRHCPCRKHTQGRHDQGAFGAGRVDRRADRSLHRKPQQAADGCHQPYSGLAPVLLRYQENVEVGAERASHIGEQEVDRVERRRTEPGGVF
jgi:hypothetical protein